jgi:superfamily II helicase
MTIDKGTLRKGDTKKKGQKYQNTHAYKHNKNSKLTFKIAEISIQGLCQRCTGILEWRKKYRKYKILTVPKKCVMCGLKNIYESYHTLCQNCSKKEKICAKCHDPMLETEENIETSDFSKAEEIRQISSMREREKRTYLRQIQKGKIPSNNTFKFSENNYSSNSGDDEVSFSNDVIDIDEEDRDNESHGFEESTFSSDGADLTHLSIDDS